MQTRLQSNWAVELFSNLSPQVVVTPQWFTVGLVRNVIIEQAHNTVQCAALFRYTNCVTISCENSYHDRQYIYPDTFLHEALTIVNTF